MVTEKENVENTGQKPRWPEGRLVLVQNGTEIKPIGRTWGGGRETTIYNAPNDVAKRLDTVA